LGRGEKRRTAEASRKRGFDVFITADQSLQFQQNLKNSRLFVIVLVAISNALEDLLPLVPAALEGIAAPKPGGVCRVGD
jgi:hypothetical protein